MTVLNKNMSAAARELLAGLLVAGVFAPGVCCAQELGAMPEISAEAAEQATPVPYENPDINLMPGEGRPVSASGVSRGANHYPGSKYKVPFFQIIKEESAAAGVDINLVLAMIDVESDFREKVQSAYAYGLMQVTPATAKWLGLQDPKKLLDARTNVRFGIKYVKVLWDMFAKGSNIADLSGLDVYKNAGFRNTVAAYNAGPDAVKKYGGVPPFKETQRYVVEVAEEYRLYQAQ